MKCPAKRVFAAVAIVGLAWLRPGPASAEESFRVEVSAERISIEARAAPLDSLLRELASQAEFMLWMPAKLDELTVSLRIEDQPLEKVLRRLLADTSYALVHGDDARVSAIFVLPRGESDSPIALTPVDDGPDLQQVLETQPAEIAEQLQQALGTLYDSASGAVLEPPAGSEPPAAPVNVDELSEALEQIQFKLQGLGQTPDAGGEQH